jgi:hypothetical protein
MWNTRYGMMRVGSRTSGMMGAGPGGMMDAGGGMMGAGPGGMMDAGGGMMGAGPGGMMDAGGGMMGRYGGSPSWTPSAGSLTSPVTAVQARVIANRWLASKESGATAATPDVLPGYYTMDTAKDGKVDGMLSVNKQTGAVWYHWWHGRFVAMEE